MFRHRVRGQMERPQVDGLRDLRLLDDVPRDGEARQRSVRLEEQVHRAHGTRLARHVRSDLFLTQLSIALREARALDEGRSNLLPGILNELS